MTSRKKVLVTLPVLLQGGTEMQTLNLIRTLVGAGYNVVVCCFYEYDGQMVVRTEEAGARVEFLHQSWGAGLLRLFLRLSAYFREQRPDVVHVQYVAPGLIPVLAARAARVPVIFATVHQPGRTYGWKAKFYLRVASRLCTTFFCVSRAVEESWFGTSTLFDGIGKGKHRHCTLYNAVDVDRIRSAAVSADGAALRSSLGIGDRPAIGAVGRLRWEKGHAILIDAMFHVVKRAPTAILLLVGDGPDRKLLEEQVQRLGLIENVIFLGHRHSLLVYQMYGIMDVVVVPSRFEGFGLVAAEAMAASVPVVAAHVDALCEVVEAGVTGSLVAPDDSSAFASSIIDFLLDSQKAKKYGENGYLRVKEKFSIEQFRKLTTSSYSYFTHLEPLHGK